MNDKLWSFVSVEANLLYIHENDLKPEFQSKLSFFSNHTIPLYIIVQLRIMPNGFEPMINNLKEIRVEKAKKKIDNWIQLCFGTHQTLIVKIDDGNTLPIHVNIDFSKINKLSAFCAQQDSRLVHTYIKNQFNKENFNISFL